MTLLYADTSAFGRAYFQDEPEHASLGALLLGGGERVVTSELTRLELAAAVMSALRARRLRRAERVLGQIESDLSGNGPVTVLALHAHRILPRAYGLVLDHGVRTLDALHLAVALDDAAALAAGEELVFVTRDREQADAATALGLAVA